MNNYQDILESHDKIYNLSITYTGKEITSVHNNVELIYTDSGIPYIEMYPGDKIEITKKVFINTKEVFGEFEDKKDFSLNDEEQNEGLSFNSTTNVISAIKPGTYKINSNMFGTLDISNYDITNVNDPDVLIVIKEIPEIKEIMWGYSNPWLIQLDKNASLNEQLLPFNLKVRYSDNVIKSVSSEFIYNNFNLTSSNKSLVIINFANLNPIIGTFIVFSYNDQANISISLKESSTLKNIKLPKDLQVIVYDKKENIDKIKQSVHYIYFLSDDSLETNIVTDKPYYIEKGINKTFYVKMLNGYFDYGKFNITDCKEISQYVSLLTESSNIKISRQAANNAFLIKGNERADNIIINMKYDECLPQSEDVIFNNINVIDSIRDIHWTINDKTIVLVQQNKIIEHNTSVNLDVTDKHNILLNKVIAITQSGEEIDITSDCIFSSTEKDNLNINNNITIEDNKMIVSKSHECKIILNGSTKYKLPDILEREQHNFVIANITMTKEDVFCNKIEVYESGVTDLVLLNDTELTLKMLSEKTLYAIVYPEDATYKNVSWYSDDTSVATIDDNGKLKIVNAGFANIICRIKYPEPEDPIQPDYVNDKNNPEDKKYYDPDTGELKPLEFNPPDIFAIVKINATKINVSEISFDRNSTTLYVDGDRQPYYIRVKPEGASITDVKVKFESDDVNNNFFGIDSNDEMYVRKSGTGKLIAYSVDDPSITAEMKIIGIDTTVKKVTINTAPNDNDYEYYDHLNERKIYTSNNTFDTAGDRVTNEKYDDDDFNRYYLPVNNSMQLSANIEPNDAINTKIKWLSSNSSLVKVNDKGIITAIREGTQELDVYGDDDISESRFANTAWITAINTKYNKYDVCHVRVTRNKTLAIDIPTPAEHDYDVDDILPDGTYDTKAEHEFDYVMYVGDTISIPVTLTTQDNNFGTSDSLVWFYDSKASNIIEISKGTPDHSNAYDPDFDWTTNTPGLVNSNKNTFNVEVKAIGLGDAYFYAKTKDNVRGIGKKQIYVPASSYVTEINKHPGLTGLDMSYGAVSLNVYYYSKECLAIRDIKNRYRKYLNQLLEANFSGEGTVVTNINGVQLTIWQAGINKVDEALDSVIDESYIATRGVALVGAKCILNPNGILKIIVPDVCHIDNLKTKGENSIPLTFDFVPTIDKKPVVIVDENGNETLDISKTNEYIYISVYGINEKLKSMPIYLDAIYKDKNNATHRQMYVTKYIPWKDEANTANTYVVDAYFPANKTDDINLDSGDPFNARPGMGVWVDGPKSRKVTVRVVAAPSKLKIGWINAYNTELLNINTIRDNSITRNSWSKNKYHYMAIGTDDEFKGLIADAESWGGTLAEKYKSFAWFSDNENVIRFEDVEDLSYIDSKGKYTNNPNESIKETKSETQSISFKNINADKFTTESYRYVGPICSVKFGDDYTYTNQDDLYVNNTSLCILRLEAPNAGRFYINHTGTIQYANNEFFTGAKTLSVTNGYKDSFIDAKLGDVIYVKGATSTIVYIRSMGFYWNNGGTTAYTSSGITNKTSTEYCEYNNVYIKLPNNDSRMYLTSSGIRLWDETTAIKYIAKYDGEITLTFKEGNGIKIKNKSLGTKTIGTSASPYTLNVKQGETYIIYGNSGSGTILSTLEYTNTIESGTPGGYKGTTRYKVKSSFMKRVICEGHGTANIYVLSPKGQALVKKTITIK